MPWAAVTASFVYPKRELSFVVDCGLPPLLTAVSLCRCYTAVSFTVFYIQKMRGSFHCTVFGHQEKAPLLVQYASHHMHKSWSVLQVAVRARCKGRTSTRYDTGYDREAMEQKNQLFLLHRVAIVPRLKRDHRVHNLSFSEAVLNFNVWWYGGTIAGNLCLDRP